MTDLIGPELLDEHHELDGFDCGDQRLDDWLAGKARRNQIEGSSRTWVVTTEGRVVAFYASSTAVAARNQPDPLPALLLGRLAVDDKWQGHGLGAALLKHFIVKSLEVAVISGVRVLLVHAKTAEIAAFHRRYGFEPSPIDDLTLMLLVKDITA